MEGCSLTRGRGWLEPHRLRRWRRGTSTDRLAFYTCARPGRSKSKDDAVPDATVDKWVKGLPGGSATAVLSLLGRKPDRTSEYSFYSFCGSFESLPERGRRPLFQQWLDQRHPERALQV